MDKIMGIDISKQTFDVSLIKDSKETHHVFENKRSGFEKLAGHLDQGCHVVMEASGPYYLELASFLHQRGVTVSVVNPLMVKRFSQMNFYRAKTDKKDAAVIRKFAISQFDELPIWKPESHNIQSLKQIRTVLDLLNKQLSQTNNQMQAFVSSGYVDPAVRDMLGRSIATIKRRIAKLERQMLEICNRDYRQTLELLTSIPGIGLKTAIMLIAITGDFDKFSHYRQLIAYVGLSPMVYQSGTSVKGKGHICKMGKSQIRKLLYMCSWTAKRNNNACVDMYERLKTKGKPERVIKIAIANKLLKQAFAIATTKTKYEENFQMKTCI
jgi:transposase